MLRVLSRLTFGLLLAVAISASVVTIGAQSPVPPVGCDATCVGPQPPPPPPPPPPQIPGVGCDATCTPVILPPVIITAPAPTIGPQSPYAPAWGPGSAACGGAIERAELYCELDFLLGADGSMCDAFMDMMDSACGGGDDEM